MVVRDIHKNSVYLMITMTLVVLITLVIAITSLYRVGFQESEQRLVETVKSQARLMEAVARFDKAHSGALALQETLSQISEAHSQFEGFGNTGEFTLAKLQNNQIIFLLNHRHDDMTQLRPVPFESEAAEPMRQALQGKSGTLIGLDYRGEIVLAAYEPVSELNLGVVAKIDLDEIRTPYIQAAWITLGITLLVIFSGLLVFQRITRATIKDAEEFELRFKRLADNAKVMIYRMSIPEGIYEYVSPSSTQIFGVSPEAFYKDPLVIKDLISPEFHNYFEVEWGALVVGKSSPTYEYQIMHKDGGLRWIHQDNHFVTDHNGKILAIEGVVSDITDQKALEKRWEDLSFIDGLTGISNRRAFDKMYEREWKRSTRSNTPLSLIMIDVDFFKGYNDYYGHLQGDEALKTVATCLSEIIQRAPELVARYGGEEFIIALPDTDSKRALQLAERCRRCVLDRMIPYESSTVCPSLSISLGVGTITPTQGIEASILLSEADKALYYAKENGRNRTESSHI